jgi:glycine/D-amino acid oxidase-like deaminating enzyme
MTWLTEIHDATHQESVASLWASTAPPGPPLVPLGADTVADVAIVGAGFTGLAAAITLADAGRGVVVLEAAQPGYGASGRNGGQVIPGLKDEPDELEARHGSEDGPRLVRTVAAGPDLVFDLIRRFAIDCDARRAGWIQPSHTEATWRLVQRRAAQWQARQAPVRVLAAVEVAALTGSRLYNGGWLDERAGTVQPLAYVRGLARAATSLGVKVHTESPVVALEPEAGGWRARTPHGTVRARQVLIATNAYSGPLHDALRRSVVAVPSFQVATKPLSREWRQRILPGGHAVSDTYNLLRYYRLDAAGRLVVGARGMYGRRTTAQLLRNHTAALGEIYPDLGPVEYEYCWNGYVAVTTDHVPHLHDLGQGLYAALGYNGRGVAMATMLGRLAAGLALGRADPDGYFYPVTPLEPIPLHAFSRIGVRATIAYLRMKDGRWLAEGST